MFELDFTKIATAIIMGLLVWNFTTVKDLSEKTAILIVRLDSLEANFNQKINADFSVLKERIDALDKRIQALEKNKG